MEPIRPPQTIKYYQLLKMATKTGFSISACGPTSTNYVGTGIYHSLQEAEHNRLIETLKDTDGGANSYHVFELEFPNPAYKD